MAAAPAPETNLPDESPAPKKPGLMTLIKAVAALSILVLLQVVAVGMFMPSASETAEVAKKMVADEAHEETEEKSEGHGEHGAGEDAKDHMREVSLGDYHVVTYNADSGSTVNVDFELFGTVLASEEPEYLELFAANEIRLREQILVTIRGSDITELSDPDLDLLKRKILEKTNRTLGKPLVYEAVFSKFSFIER